MSFNGSGQFNLLYNWQNDAAQGLDISSSRMQGQDADIAAGLSLCITKDGQQTAAANLPMGGFRHTNVANAQYTTEYATVGQIQTAGLTLLGAGAGTASFPSITVSGSGGLTLGNAVSPDVQPIKFGDGSGWLLPFEVAAGANAGTVFATLSDQGALVLDGPLSSTGSVSGSSISSSGAISASGAISGASVTASGIATIKGAAATFRNLQYETGTTLRWVIAATNDAESGSNAGSNLGIYSYTDAGALLATPLLLNRASGLATFSVRPTWGGGATPWDTANLGFASNAAVQAGASSTSMVSPAGLASAMLGGNGQVWRNVTSSRAIGTSYTNSTGRPIMVSAALTSPTTIEAAQAGATVTGVSVGSVTCNESNGSAYQGINQTLSFIVPNGAAYSISAIAGVINIVSWAELS